MHPRTITLILLARQALRYRRARALYAACRATGAARRRVPHALARQLDGTVSAVV
jgi:hypothetical protein